MSDWRANLEPNAQAALWRAWAFQTFPSRGFDGSKLWRATVIGSATFVGYRQASESFEAAWQGATAAALHYLNPPPPVFAPQLTTIYRYPR